MLLESLLFSLGKVMKCSHMSDSQTFLWHTLHAHPPITHRCEAVKEKSESLPLCHQRASRARYINIIDVNKWCDDPWQEVQWRERSAIRSQRKKLSGPPRLSVMRQMATFGQVAGTGWTIVTDVHSVHFPGPFLLPVKSSDLMARKD